MEIVEDLILRVHHLVKMKERQLELECKDLTVLLKPWPKWKKEDMSQSLSTTIKPAEEAVQGSDLTEEEHGQMSEMNSMLNKARKTILVRDKVSTAKSEVAPSKKFTQNNKTILATECVKERSESTKTKVVDASNNNKTHNVGIISQEKLNRALTKPGKKYTPVHASAPFKTEIGRQRPASSQYRKSYTLKNKSNVKSGDVKSRPLKSSEKLSNSAQVDEPINNDFNMTSAEPNVVERKEVNEDETVLTDRPDVVDEEEVIRERLERTALSDVSGPENNSVSSTDEEKPFLLSRDGSTFKIPGQLRKLLNSNHRLRNLVRQKNNTVQTPSAPCKEAFLSRIESQFSDVRQMSPEATCTYAQNIYQRLLKILKSIFLEKVSDEVSIYDLLKKRKMLEFILTSYHEMELTNTVVLAEAQIFSQDNPPSNINHRNLPNTRSPSNLWYPVSAVPLTRGGPMKCLHWSSIEEYNTLLFNIQEKQLQLNIIQAASNDYLPLLTRHSELPSSLLPVFRGLYSILCTSGFHFPAFIKDNIAELESQ